MKHNTQNGTYITVRIPKQQNEYIIYKMTQKLKLYVYDVQIRAGGAH